MTGPAAAPHPLLIQAIAAASHTARRASTCGTDCRPKKFGVLASSCTMSAGSLPRNLFRITRLLVDASNDPSAFALGVATRTMPPENSVSPRLSLHDVLKDGVVLRSREDDAAAAEDGQESVLRELRAHVVVVDDRVVQHRVVAAAAGLTIGQQEDAETVAPDFVVGHDASFGLCRTRMPRALSQLRLWLTTALASSESPT